MPTPPSTLRLPSFVSTLLAPSPRKPMAALLSVLTRRLVERRPELLRRLGTVVHVPIAVVPDDLPHAFLLRLDAHHNCVRICKKSEITAAQAVIKAPMLILLGLLDGTYDGDALFFSRDLRIEGKTDYVLALRNAMDNADLKPADFLGLSGNSAQWVDRLGLTTLEKLRTSVTWWNQNATRSSSPDTSRPAGSAPVQTLLPPCGD